eukprot:g13466.t1
MRSMYAAYGLNPDAFDLRFRLGTDEPAMRADQDSTGTLHPDLYRVLTQDGFAIDTLDLGAGVSATALQNHLASDQLALVVVYRSTYHWVLVGPGEGADEAVVYDSLQAEPITMPIDTLLDDALSITLIEPATDEGMSVSDAHTAGLAEMARLYQRNAMNDPLKEDADSQAMQTKPAFPIGWVLAVLLVLGVWAGAYALRGGGSGEVMAGWADGMSAGQALAEDADKPMMVLFTAGWCPPCQQLKKHVLSKPEVNDALQAGFVPVQIDLTQQSGNPNMQVAQQYGVTGIPAVIVMTPEGERIQAYAMPIDGPDAAHFMGWLDGLSQ